jgi:hypothetical protein
MDFKDTDTKISEYMERTAIPAVRISFAIIFYGLEF